MADDGFKIELDPDLGSQLQDAARAAGVSTDAYASELISQGLGDPDWRETMASLAHYDRTGEFVDADEALDVSSQQVVHPAPTGKAVVATHQLSLGGPDEPA